MKVIALLTLVLTTTLSLISANAAETGAYQVKVPAMKCAGCAWSIGEELKKVDHITEVFVDPKTKVAVFAVDSAAGPDEKAILAAVKAAGYEGSGYAKLTTTFAEAKAALSKS